MQVVYQHCAGLDVHKKTVVACLITPKEKGGWEKEIRTFSTMTKDLLNLSDWLTSKGCTQVAMESTGEYWRPVFRDRGTLTAWVITSQFYSPSPTKGLTRLNPPSE
jgi:ligand-binding sensor domain-containing protein